jgi:Tfp pilus assembly protein PilF
MNAIESFLALLESGRDDALLRFGLGNAYLKAGEPAAAAEHLARAVEHDPDYTAAWKLLGKALAESNQRPAAMDAYRQGIEVAEQRGDVQAGKEMRVFLRRLEKHSANERK